ncbi:MAG: SDR family oxidoreductase [Candidatus Competibacter sp.]|nr:SDR family oxidoreductase [Candidatus Competibacter sp.]
MSVLLTHVRQYAGPGSVPVLLREHHTLYCHDASFVDPAAARNFEAEHAGAVALAAQTPHALADELAARDIAIETVIHNDVHPNTPLPIEEIPTAMLQAAFDALLLFPAQLTQRLLPAMKARRSGRFVFVTSARYRQAEPGFAVATSIRAATTAFALALAREVAPYGIQVNVVAPNYLYSEAYYPRARFIDDPAGRAHIAAKVPLGRLGKPEEIGELIGFLASGRSPFVTGQVIDFTGGWP